MTIWQRIVDGFHDNPGGPALTRSDARMTAAHWVDAFIAATRDDTRPLDAMAYAADMLSRLARSAAAMGALRLDVLEGNRIEGAARVLNRAVDRGRRAPRSRDVAAEVASLRRLRQTIRREAATSLDAVDMLDAYIQGIIDGGDS